MNTKTCKKCGWEYPIKTPYSSCKFCGAPFTTGICVSCGEFSTDIVPCSGQHCRACHNKRTKEYKRNSPISSMSSKKTYDKYCREVDEQFDKWLKRLTAIKTHNLTEEEWLKAVAYFNGCALCDSESIESRSYFISFKDGGRYNRCNVIPLCDKCATALIYQRNPFRRLHPSLSQTVRPTRELSKQKLSGVVDYLQRAMEDAENE